MIGRLADGANTAQQMLDLPSELRNVSRRPTPVDECANLTASTGPRRLFPCNGGICDHCMSVRNALCRAVMPLAGRQEGLTYPVSLGLWFGPAT